LHVDTSATLWQVNFTVAVRAFAQGSL